MKVSCDVIRDLLPLYAENLASKDTCALLEEHLEGCPGCKAELEQIVQPQKYAPDTHVESFRKARKKLNTTKVYTAILAALITLVITLTIVVYLTAPQYLPYSQEVVTVSEQEDGTVYLTFSQQVAGYEMLSSNGTGSGTEYLVTAWNTTWHKRVSPKDIGSIVVNPNREKVAAIYYYTAEYPSNDVYGDNTHLLYGNLTAEGFVVLPRLFLAYYVFFALLLLGTLAVLYLVFRKNDRTRSILGKALLLPASYLIAHLCVKGWTTTSFSATRDFAIIMLVMFPVYAVLLLTANLCKRYWRTNGDSK